MRSELRPLSIVLAAFCCWSIFASAARAAQPFEGTRWKVTVTPDDAAANAGEKEFDEVFIFKGGKFVAQMLAKAPDSSRRSSMKKRRPADSRLPSPPSR